jgi:hypothetical protein
MGRQRRLIYLGRAAQGAWLCTASALLVVGCSSADDARRAEQRRQLLRGEDLEKSQQDRLNKLRLTTYDGDLLPSDTRMAGVVLPRGFALKFTFEYEWYYDGALPLNKVEKYFGQQLDFEAIERPDAYSIVYAQAKTKGDTAMKPVAVKIYPVPGRSDWSRIYIHASKPLPEHIPTPDEVRALLAARPRNE